MFSPSFAIASFDYRLRRLLVVAHVGLLEQGDALEVLVELRLDDTLGEVRRLALRA